jgi:glycerophosphoryl diester phosphodiesterase
LATDAGLDEVATYADGIGPWKNYIISSTLPAGGTQESDRKLLPPTDLVARAHARGLLVHPYTFRSEGYRLVSDYGGNPINEYLAFYRAGVDGLFSDFAGTAFAARDLFWLERSTGEEALPDS